MSSFPQFNNRESESKVKSLRLPKPDPANITVLTPNLPNKPILPWTHFDSPWLDSHLHDSEEPENQESTVDNQESSHPQSSTNDK
ncbi:hypothetical protein NUACC21_06950 [Scytonema sp. NUACC21]